MNLQEHWPGYVVVWLLTLAAWGTGLFSWLNLVAWWQIDMALDAILRNPRNAYYALDPHEGRLRVAEPTAADNYFQWTGKMRTAGEDLGIVVSLTPKRQGAAKNLLRKAKKATKEAQSSSRSWFIMGGMMTVASIILLFT